jgi:predicted Zn-dependent protease
MEKIINLLKKYDDISDYRIIKNDVDSYELFFVHESLETVRATSTSSLEVTLYVDFKSYRGNSTFSINNADDEESINAKIVNAINMAKLITNKKFKLPKDEVLDETLKSNFSDYEPKVLGAKMFNILKECSSKVKGQLNATEIFIYKTTTHLINSKGIDKKCIKYSSMIETIPTYDTKNDSVEIYTQLNFTSFDEKWLKEQISQALKDVTARSKAKKLDHDINVNVILRPQEIEQIIRAYVNELNYMTIYNKFNILNVNDDIQQNSQGDKLNVSILGQIENCSSSRLFDNDGITLKKKVLIKGGVLVNTYGSNTYAQYLHKKPTGDLNLISLGKGKKSPKELKENPYLECASFSGLQVDLMNDYIGGEVRLAYYFDGQKTTPVTSLSISGKLSEVIKNIVLSNKITTVDSYKGPSLALLTGMKIF